MGESVAGRLRSACAGLPACHCLQMNPQRRSIFSLPLEALVLNIANSLYSTIDFKMLVVGGWGGWSSWEECNLQCETSRSRLCDQGGLDYYHKSKD